MGLREERHIYRALAESSLSHEERWALARQLVPELAAYAAHRGVKARAIGQVRSAARRALRARGASALEVYVVGQEVMLSAQRLWP